MSFSFSNVQQRKAAEEHHTLVSALAESEKQAVLLLLTQKHFPAPKISSPELVEARHKMVSMFSKVDSVQPDPNQARLAFQNC